MTAQEWLEIYDKNYPWSIESIRDAATIIRDQQDKIENLTAELKEREGEVEKLTHERDLWENMAAMRLADQEDIERHTRRVVAGEICEYLCKEWPFMGAGAVMDIKERYGVE